MNKLFFGCLLLLSVALTACDKNQNPTDPNPDPVPTTTEETNFNARIEVPVVN